MYPNCLHNELWEYNSDTQGTYYVKLSEAFIRPSLPLWALLIVWLFPLLLHLKAQSQRAIHQCHQLKNLLNACSSGVSLAGLQPGAEAEPEPRKNDKNLLSLGVAQENVRDRFLHHLRGQLFPLYLWGFRLRLAPGYYLRGWRHSSKH